MSDTSRRVNAVVTDWFSREGRDLPWRRPEATPWGIVVSEVMLQQTPVARVTAPWTSWTRRWPTPSALASEPAGAAVAAWDRLGYPRRALRLHAAAVAMVERHRGEVPDRHADLLALPGFGAYTAAAVASFAFGQRHVVLDTNVRRVLARVAAGRALPSPSPTVAERTLAAQWLPPDDAASTPLGPHLRPLPSAAAWNVAAMELGALVCTARAPACARCPVRGDCAWVAAGSPAHDGPPRRGQAWNGTDRQCRGVLLGLIRAAAGSGTEPVDTDALLASWPDRPQALRAVASLAADGLIHPDGAGWRL